MKKVYLNTRDYEGVETIAELVKEEGQSPKDFRLYINQMVREYQTSGINVYRSSRCTNDWKQK